MKTVSIKSNRYCDLNLDIGYYIDLKYTYIFSINATIEKKLRVMSDKNN